MILYLTFFLYFCIIFTIGLYAFRSTKSHEDYVIGGRKLNAVITALGVGASDMSGWLMIGLPGAIYLFGMDHLWMPIGLLLGAYLNWRFVSYRLRLFTIEASNSLTIPSYLEHRFNDTSGIIRTLTSVVVIIFFTIYSSAGFVSSGILFSTTFGISYHAALLIGVTLLVVYTSIGGFLAVNWVDVFQGGLMLLALIFLPVYILFVISYVNPALLSTEFLQNNFASQFNSDYFNFLPSSTDPLAFVTLFSTLAWGLGYFGQPHILVRFMASESAQAITKARRICMSWMALALLGAVCVGFFGKIFYVSTPLADAEQVFFALVEENVNEWLAGWLIAAVLSCVMSTVAAQLILSSSALCEDIYHARINSNASDKKLLWVGRSTVLIVSLIALFFAWNKNSSVLDLVGHAWAGLGSSFGPVILFSLFWRKMPKQAAIAGILSGALTVLVWFIARYYYADVLHVELPLILQVYEIIPGFVVSSISIFFMGISNPNKDQKVLELYNRAHHLCKDA